MFMRILLLLFFACQDSSPTSAIEDLTTWEPERRNRAIGTLSQMKADGKLDLLVPFLKSTDYGGRAAEALAMMGPRTLVPKIAALLPGANLYTRCAAVLSLWGIGGDAARDALVEDLKRTDTDPGETIQALGKVGLPADVLLLLPFLRGSAGGVEALPIAELAAKGTSDRQTVVDALVASKTLGARIALVRLGRQSPRDALALLEELLRPVNLGIGDPPRETLSFGPFGIALNRALEAVYEPDAFARFEKEIVLEKPLMTLRDLGDLLQGHGFALDVESVKPCGRLPEGIRTSLRRVCDWILDQNIDPEVLENLTRGHERRIVLQGSTVKLLRLRRQADYWKTRLEGK
jgi:hypothetical protein